MLPSAKKGTATGVLGYELNFSPDWRSRPHAHLDHEELLVIKQGEIEIQCGQQLWHAREGSVVLYSRGVEHCENATNKKPVRLLCLSWKSPRVYQHQELIHSDFGGRIQTAAQWILDWISRKTPESSEAASLLMQSILLELDRPPVAPCQEFAERAKAYMLSHLAEPLNLATLSKVAGLSKCHFSAKFSSVEGVSPMSYLRTLRVRNSESLILTTSLPLRTVAELVGLSDEYHFSRVFRRERGFPPSVLQKDLGRLRR